MFATIVTGVDGSDSAALAVHSAAALAAAVGGHLHVVTVLDDLSPGHSIRQWSDPAQDSADALAAAVRIADASGVTVTTHRMTGDPATAIIRAATEVHADLIVVGNRGLRSTSRFASDSVPSRIVLHSPCSVLIIRTK